MKNIGKISLLIGIATQQNVVCEESMASLLERADQLFWLDNWSLARVSFAEAEGIAKQNGDKRNELYARFSRLRADAERESYAGILAALNSDELNPLLSSDPLLRLRFYEVRGSVNMSINPEAAKADWEQVIKAARLIRGEAWEGRAKGELSICAFLAGDFAKAKALSDEALQVAVSTSDVASEVRQRSLKGVALLEQRRYDEAQALIDKALKLAEHTPNIRFPIMAYMAKAEILTANGFSAEGDALVARLQTYLQNAGASVYLADLNLERAQRANRHGDVPGAIELYKSAAKAASSVRMPRPYSAAHYNLARIQKTAGDYKAALDHIQEALSASEQLLDTYVLPHQLALAAEISVALKDNASASAYYERAQDTIEGLLTRVPAPGARSALIAAFSAVYFGHFQMAIASDQSTKAFRILERAKGRVITEILRSSTSNARSPVRPADLNAVDVARIQTALLKEREPVRRRQLLEQLFDAELLLDTPTRLKEAKADPASVSQLRHVLGENEVVLEYALGDPTSYCVVLTKSGIQLQRLGAAKTIESAVDSYLRAVRAKDQISSAELSKSANRLYSLLLAPIAVLAVKSRIIVVPDQSLSALPFEALVDSNGQMMIHSTLISYEPSATALYLVRSRPRREGVGNRLLAVAASPVGSGGSAVAGNLTRDLQVDSSGEERGMFDLQGGTFSRLPFTADEVAMTSRIMGWSSTVLGGETATEAAFKKQPLSSFRILHLAMHGVADRRFPERSALVLPSAGSPAEDGLLQPREIMTFPIRADLVTLSACETAAGKVLGIEGVASLVRAFLLAGARGIVASLWKADDRFTAALMTRFYTHIAAGVDTAAALRAAKLDLIRRYGNRALPYYWAGFTFTGDSVQISSLSRN